MKLKREKNIFNLSWYDIQKFPIEIHNILKFKWLSGSVKIFIGSSAN